MSLDIGPIIRVEGHVKAEVSIDPREMRCNSVRVRAIEGAINNKAGKINVEVSLENSSTCF